MKPEEWRKRAERGTSGDMVHDILAHWDAMYRLSTIEYEYAKDLAVRLWQTHYKADAPEWEPCEDLMGVLTQIDNMVVGLQPKKDHEIKKGKDGRKKAVPVISTLAKKEIKK